MLATHGARYLALKADGIVAERAARFSRWTALGWVLLFAVAGVWLARGGYGFRIVSGALRRRLTESAREGGGGWAGAWFANYRRGHWHCCYRLPGLLAPVALTLVPRARRMLDFSSAARSALPASSEPWA